PAGRSHRFDPVKRIVVRRPQQISHSSVGDDELLSAAPLSIKNARQQHSGIAHQKSPRLQDDPEPGLPHQRTDHFAKLGDINRALGGIVGDGETATDVEILEGELRLALDLTTQVQQALQPDLVRCELRDLRADVHVEPQQAHVRERRGDFGNGQRFVERDPELHSLLARAGVRMWRVDEHFRIHAQSDGRLSSKPAGDSIEHVQLLLRLDVEEQNLGVECVLHLPLGLSHSAEDDVLAGVSSLEGTIQLAAGYNVEAGAELAQQCQDGDAGVGLYTVVKPGIDAHQRVSELLVLRADNGGAVDVTGCPDLARDHIEGNSFTMRALPILHRLSASFASAWSLCYALDRSTTSV